jgi:tryptophan 2,3-dioxygenase
VSDRPSSSFGEEGGRLSYGSYLALTELLAAQRTLTDAPDELLFIVVHQAYELWFKVLLCELERARDAVADDDLLAARHHFRRIKAVERLLLEQVDVIETMAPGDFLKFRSELAPASGFQSVQFREIEYVSGLKDDGAVLSRLASTPEERARLERRRSEPTLWDAFCGLLERRGSPPLAEVVAGHRSNADLFEVAEALIDHDEAILLWRFRHVAMVERQIGTKIGTGGSTGAAYLKATLEKRFYPELWQVRAEL